MKGSSCRVGFQLWPGTLRDSLCSRSPKQPRSDREMFPSQTQLGPSLYNKKLSGIMTSAGSFFSLYLFVTAVVMTGCQKRKRKLRNAPDCCVRRAFIVRNCSCLARQVDSPSIQVCNFTNPSCQASSESQKN